MGEIGAQIIDLATTVDTIRGTNIAKDESTLNRLSDTAYDNIYQALSETNDNVTERDVQNYLFQQRLQDYTNQSDFGTGGKYTRAIQAVTAFTQGIMGGNIVTAIANGSAPYLANEVKNQIQGNSVESDIQRTLAHGLVNAGLALAKGENAAAQAAGAMTGETMGILSHSLYGKTPEELTESEKQNISAWATLASGIAGGLISDNSAGVANAAQAGKVVVENNVFGPGSFVGKMVNSVSSDTSLAFDLLDKGQPIDEINKAIIYNHQNPSWGVEYKVNPYINFDGNIGAGVIGTYGDIGIYHDKFLVNGGASSGIFGLNATMGAKIKFGPYRSRLTNYLFKDFSFNMGMGNFSFSAERDGISVILGAGPSYGMAGSGHINMDAKMGNELYKKDFYIKEIENDENIDQ